MWLVRVRKENLQHLRKVRMWRKTLTLVITVFCISHHHCDNRFNDRYNSLVTSDNLKKEIDAQLPKQSKFFDMNDFDCKFFLINWTSNVCRWKSEISKSDDLLLSIFFRERKEKIVNPSVKKLSVLYLTFLKAFLCVKLCESW